MSLTEDRDEEQEDEGEEEMRDGGVPFYVNRGGFPVDEETWERMWRHVARIHPNAEVLAKEIRSATDLPKVKSPNDSWTNLGLPFELVPIIIDHFDIKRSTANNCYSSLFSKYCVYIYLCIYQSESRDSLIQYKQNN